MNVGLRRVAVVVAAAVVVFACGACGSWGGGAPEDPGVPIPTAIGCEDAAKFQSQADASETVADKENNYNGILQHRAEGIFWAAVATTATLKCSGAVSPEADSLLVKALAEARMARSVNDYREITSYWDKAVVAVLQANNALLASRKSPSPAK